MAWEGVDYSFQRPSATNLKLAGKWFVGSYAGPGFGKFFTKAEIGALHALGIAVVILAERFPDSALSGYAEGQSQAQEADAMSYTWGLPADRPIYFAVDFDMQVAQRPAVKDFLDGCAAVIGRNRVGVYGGIRTTEWASQNRYASWFYQTYAWSDGEWGPAAHIQQYRNDQILGGAQVDLDRSYVTDYGQWPHPVESIGPAPTSTPQPVTDTSSWDFVTDVAGITNDIASAVSVLSGVSRTITAVRG
jgi:Domain of unknown function (DUF1906)